jgi:hypothetical protein
MRGTKENGYQPQRVEFKPEWFDPESLAVPDPDMLPEIITG